MSSGHLEVLGLGFQGLSRPSKGAELCHDIVSPCTLIPSKPHLKNGHVFFTLGKHIYLEPLSCELKVGTTVYFLNKTKYVCCTCISCTADWSCLVLCSCSELLQPCKVLDWSCNVSYPCCIPGRRHVTGILCAGKTL